MLATGPQEAEAYSATEVEAIERDLKCYSDSYWYLQLQEVESCYGPVEPTPQDLQALCSKGTRVGGNAKHIAFYPQASSLKQL